jgi:hypothetical protein
MRPRQRTNRSWHTNCERDETRRHRSLQLGQDTAAVLRDQGHSSEARK